MLYLCIVMMKLVDSPTHIKKINKIMKDKVVDNLFRQYLGVDSLKGYYSLHVKKGSNYTPPSLYVKFTITECLLSRPSYMTEKYPIFRGHRSVRRINSNIVSKVTHECVHTYLKHFGVKRYELSKTMIVWPTR
jgi:hypothetical protein